MYKYEVLCNLGISVKRWRERGYLHEFCTFWGPVCECLPKLTLSPPTPDCTSRASDKRRNLAQQKAEAQRRLYGQGSMKKLSAGSSDWEKQRHTLERRKEELVRANPAAVASPRRPRRSAVSPFIISGSGSGWSRPVQGLSVSPRLASCPS